MEMAMTVNRAKLVEALEEARGEVAERLQKRVDKARAELEEAKGSSNMGAYLLKVADLVEAGEMRAQVQPHMGKEGVMVIFSPAKRFGEMPEPPQPQRGRSVTALAAELSQRELDYQRAVAPYDAALKLLGMSEDETVGIPASEYQRLLEKRPAAPRRVDDDEFED